MNDEPKTTSTGLSTKPLRQVSKVTELLSNEQARRQLAMVAAKHMSPERMMRMLANAVRTTPKLAECTPLSVLGALMQCAAIGLEPNTQKGHAYLIPFDKTLNYGKPDQRTITEVQLIIGYKGYKHLSFEAGSVYIHAEVHYSDDVLMHHQHGYNHACDHIAGPKKGEKLGAYCVIIWKTAQGFEGKGHVYMTKDEILAIRDRSQGWKTAVKAAAKYKKPISSPWATDEDAMWAKTAVRHLAQSGGMPMGREVSDAVEADEVNTDFANFALNPMDGPMIEGEAVDPEDENQDGDVVEGTTAKTGKSALDVGRENAAKEAEKAKAEDPKKDAPAKEDAKPEPDQAKPTVQISEAMQKQVDTIRADLLDAGPGNVDALMEMYAPLLGDIETFAPEIYAEIKAEAAALKAQAPKGEE